MLHDLRCGKVSMYGHPKDVSIKTAMTGKRRESELDIVLVWNCASESPSFYTRSSAYVHTPYVCTSYGETFKFLRQEHWRLQLADALYHGTPKVWLIVDPRDSDKLEAYVGELLELEFTCSQFLGHQNVFLNPRQLEQWKIRFNIIVQNPGEIVMIDYGVYHQVYSPGVNIAVTTKGCDDSWLPPFAYQACRKSCDREKVPISRDMMRIADPKLAIFKTSSQVPSEPQRKSQNNPEVWPGRSGGDDAMETPGQEKGAGEQSEEEVKVKVKRKSRKSRAKLARRRHTKKDASKTSAEESELELLISMAVELGEHILPKMDSEKRHEILGRYKTGRGMKSWLHEDTVNLTLDIMTSSSPEHVVWPNTVFTLQNLDWIEDYEDSAQYVLAPRCIADHWELVHLDVQAHRATLYGKECQIFREWVVRAGSVLAPRAEWDVTYRLPTFQQENVVDCALIVFAEVDILLPPNLQSIISTRSDELRTRYLRTLVTWARGQAEAIDLSGCINRYPTCPDAIQSSVFPCFIQSYPSNPRALDSFAAPKTLADVCSLRQSQIQSTNGGCSMFLEVLKLLSTSKASIMQANWHMRLSSALIYQRYLAWQIVVGKEMREEKRKHRRAVRAGEASAQVMTTVKQKRKNNRVYEKMLDEWIGPVGTLREERKAALKSIVKSAEAMATFFDLMGDGTASPFWVLAPYDALKE